MRLPILAIAVCSLVFSCGKKKKYGDVSAAIMKSQTVSTSLVPQFSVAESGANLLATGSMEQSFTPTSLKIAIYSVSLCSGGGSCQSLYKCSANTVADCSVELSKIDAFVEALNTGTTEFEDGATFDQVSVQYCPDGDSSGLQHITVNGTFKLQGVDYATDPTSGIVAGTTGKDVQIDVKGGCGSLYNISPTVTVAKDSPIKVRLFFDATMAAYGGTAGEGGNMATYSSQSCAGSSSAYVCVPVTTVVGTVDSGTPTAEHYLVSNTDSSADNSPTGNVVIYYSSDGTPIGGVQNPYRVSGSSVSWGTRIGGGLGLVPKVVDSTTISFGEPGGSISLADWFKNFKRSSHTGTYTYANTSGGSSDGSYKATKY